MINISRIKTFIRNAVYSAGYDIRRTVNRPQHTLCGLRPLPIRSVIDVGANKGQFAKYITTIFADAHIYCFEPLDEPFRILSSFAENENSRISVYQVALGNEIGQRQIYSHTQHSSSSSFLETTDLSKTYYPELKEQKKEEVRLDTLDNIFFTELQNIEAEILIKLDVQGYEDRVILGGKEAFRKISVCIIEINLEGLYIEQAGFDQLVNAFYGMGFVYAGNLDQHYSDEGRVVSIDAVFKKSK